MDYPTRNVRRREREIYKITLVGSAWNFVLIIFKFAAGFLGSSSAMIADAIHSLSDFLTDIVVLVFVKVSSQPKDKTHNYGHGKFETLATLIVGMVLGLVGMGVAWNGINQMALVFGGEKLQSPGYIALAAALISIAIKEALYRYTIAPARRLNSDAMAANAWHHRSDAFSSIATAAGIGGAVLLGPNWAVLDPLAAFIVSFFILKTAFALVLPSLDELLEKSLPPEADAEIRRIVNSFDSATRPHNIRTRKIGNYSAIELHVCMNPDISLKDAHDTATKIENAIKRSFGRGTHVTVHMEPRA